MYPKNNNNNFNNPIYYYELAALQVKFDEIFFETYHLDLNYTTPTPVKSMESLKKTPVFCHQ